MDSSFSCVEEQNLCYIVNNNIYMDASVAQRLALRCHLYGSGFKSRREPGTDFHVYGLESQWPGPAFGQKTHHYTEREKECLDNSVSYAKNKTCIIFEEINL